jgi:hypothetical protein
MEIPIKAIAVESSRGGYKGCIQIGWREIEVGDRLFDTQPSAEEYAYNKFLSQMTYLLTGR